MQIVCGEGRAGPVDGHGTMWFSRADHRIPSDSWQSGCHLKATHAVTASVSTLAVLTFVACVRPPQATAATYRDAPDRVIAEELVRHEAVMLGDFQHGGAYSLQSLLRVLEAWATNPRSPHSLTLFLERDSEAADILTRYLRSGDMSELLDFYLPTGAVEHLEFYADLRALVGQIEDTSRLWIRGAEPGTVFDRPELGAQESYRLFVEERDSTIAAGILDHVSEFPERAVLVFYGNLHLIGNRVRKPFAPPGYPAAKTEGYYLAHYLKSALGQDEVLTVNQIPRSPEPERARPGWPDDRDILVDWDEVPANWLSPDQLDSEYDMAVVRSQSLVGTHPLRQLCCRRIVEESAEDLERLIPFEPVGYHAAKYAGLDRLSLAQTTGETFAEPEGWRQWLSAQAYDGVARLMSPGFEDHVVGLIRDLEQGDNGAAGQLVGLGLPLRGFRPILQGGEAAWREFWSEHRDEVFAMQAVGLWWCGDTAEREWARTYLTETSGRRFEAPRDALKWWRARYRPVTY